MAQKTELTITVEERKGRIPYSSFVTIFNNAIGLLNDIADNIRQRTGDSVTWMITDISMKSPLSVTFAGTSPQRTLPNMAMKNCIAGINQIQNVDELPRHFTHDGLRLYSIMIGALDNDMRAIRFHCPKHGEAIATRHSFVNVQKIQKHLYHYEYTFFRGTLNDVITSLGVREFVLRDFLTNKSIKCMFKETHLRKVCSLVLKRVEVYGRTKFTRKGDPISIEVDTFDKLPSTDQLRKISEAPGIDITGGIDAADYVRKIRDGEAI